MVVLNWRAVEMRVLCRAMSVIEHCLNPGEKGEGRQQLQR